MGLCVWYSEDLVWAWFLGILGGVDHHLPGKGRRAFLLGIFCKTWTRLERWVSYGWDDEAGWRDNDDDAVWEVLYGMLVWFGRVGGGEMRVAVMGKRGMHE